jgi:hypothetical protein
MTIQALNKGDALLVPKAMRWLAISPIFERIGL